MKLREIAELSCKILSISIFIKFIYYSQGFLTYFTQKGTLYVSFFRMTLIPILLLVMSLILWVFARNIANSMVKDSANNEIINLEYNKIKPIIFSIIGIIILTQAIPSLARIVVNILSDIKYNAGLQYKIGYPNLGYLFEYSFKILIALYLIIGPKKILSFSKSTRTLGQNNFDRQK